MLKLLSPSRLASPFGTFYSVVLHLPGFHLLFQSPEKYDYAYDDEGTQNITFAKRLPRIPSQAGYHESANHYGYGN